MLDQNGNFCIENYQNKPTFASFLPGIAGEHGIPMWCFYVNRGQALASFGSQDKNHAIMEFFPAHQSYQVVKHMGFRTFIRTGDKVIEPFGNLQRATRMLVGMNRLEIQEHDQENGLLTKIVYYILPQEPVGALIRKVSITNQAAQARKLEVADGMPALLPFGIGYRDMKDMAQTMQAWMKVEHVQENLPYYNVSASTGDSAVVTQVKEGNFFFALDQDSERLSVVVDPEVLFGYDTSFGEPVGFPDLDMDQISRARQITSNQVPCAFALCSKTIGAGEQLEFTEVIGRAADWELVKELCEKAQQRSWFAGKETAAVSLAVTITNPIAGKTADPVFDAYARQSYLDNVMRGGVPIRRGGQIAYIYSRKHGDLERDYNFFSMLPEFYSQGNGNYRDICQNRRSDVRYLPDTGDYNLKLFYQLIQLDGYNPLVLNPIRFHVEEQQFAETVDRLCKAVQSAGAERKVQERAEHFLQKDFTMGELWEFLSKLAAEYTGTAKGTEALFEQILQASEQIIGADFAEGYWTDHWSYNLDLLENYLSVYPEKREMILWKDATYRYYDSGKSVLARAKRYVAGASGIRQYHFLEDTGIQQGWVRTADGSPYQSSLMTKLLILMTCKMATLDPDAIGIEMEGGKPGWYDALNGLPGLIGSSVSETCELERLLIFLLHQPGLANRDVLMPEEAMAFFAGMKNAVEQFDGDTFSFWNQSNDLKEQYRSKIRTGISGNLCALSGQVIAETLRAWKKMLEKRLEFAVEENQGICPTYFSYEVTSYDERKADGSEIVPRSFRRKSLPLFLEGPVHYLKLDLTREQKKAQYDRIRASELFDRKLGMYKVNASLEGCSFELGRCRAFRPGWLENESIWLHMEYKYLLELLKNGFYQEFEEEFHSAGIPFQTYERYGRSPLENASFLVSSANENEALHGRGFVARLSGSTAEFLEIWQIMMFGQNPFYEEKTENGTRALCCSFHPFLPTWLIPASGDVSGCFLGKTQVVYHVPAGHSCIPSEKMRQEITVTYLDGTTVFCRDQIRGLDAQKIRDGLAKRIEIYMI